MNYVMLSLLGICFLIGPANAEERVDLSWLGWLRLPSVQEHKEDVKNLKVKEPEMWKVWEKESFSHVDWLPEQKLREVKKNDVFPQLIKDTKFVKVTLTPEKKRRKKGFGKGY